MELDGQGTFVLPFPNDSERMNIEQPLAAGTLLENRYRIHGLLGQGGMSRVYLADDVRLGVRVAVKENLQDTPEARKQFEKRTYLRIFHTQTFHAFWMSSRK